MCFLRPERACALRLLAWIWCSLRVHCVASVMCGSWFTQQSLHVGGWQAGPQPQFPFVVFKGLHACKAVSLHSLWCRYACATATSGCLLTSSACVACTQLSAQCSALCSGSHCLDSRSAQQRVLRSPVQGLQLRRCAVDPATSCSTVCAWWCPTPSCNTAT